MATNKIKLSTIIKRRSNLNSLSESTHFDSFRLYENLRSVMERSTNGTEAGLQQVLRSYIETMCNTVNATDYYWQPISLIEDYNSINHAISDKILYEYCNRILPYITDMNPVLECLQDHVLDESQINTITEYVSLYNTADRIANNHDMISKRFNLANEAKKLKSSKVYGLKEMIDSYCTMIDTYKVKPYQKFSIALEESFYMLNSSNIEYNNSDLLKYTLEYFLLSNPYVSDKDINNYKKVIEESMIVDESDTDQIGYLYSRTRNLSIQNSINEYLLCNDKNVDKLRDMIKESLSMTTKEDVIANVDKLATFVWDTMKSDSYNESSSDIAKSINEVSDFIQNRSEFDNSYSKEDITNVIEKLQYKLDCVELDGNANYGISEYAVEFINKGLTPCIESLESMSRYRYRESNIANIMKESTGAMPLNEFNKFKFKNLVNLSFNFDKFLHRKEYLKREKMAKKLAKGSKGRPHINSFVAKCVSKLFGESADMYNDIYSYIGDDNKADICVRQYEYTESELDDMTDFLEYVCNEYNDILYSENQESVTAYYVINPGISEVRLKDNTHIELDVEEAYKAHLALDPSLDTYMNIMVESSIINEMYSDVANNNMSILDILVSESSLKVLDVESFELALEALSFLNVDQDTIKVFGEKFADYRFNQMISEGTVNTMYKDLSSDEKKINSLVSEWSTIGEDIPVSFQLEAFDYLMDILEYNYPTDVKYDDDDEDEDDEDTKGKKPSEIVKAEEEAKAKKNPQQQKPKQDFDLVKSSKKAAADAKSFKNMSGDEKKQALKQGAKNAGKAVVKAGSKINLNNVKLGLQGLKAKFKDMDTKQKEMSNNLDNSVRAMVKSMKDALVSDRREAIIKGSLCPSFSRCIKNGMILVGLGILDPTHIVVPLITAIGGFALSKNLTRKERLLLLDEIETELEVVDKELQIADSNNEIKKYRALLRYKKELQRQYQRIRYNIRIGKDVLPGTASGMRITD